MASSTLSGVISFSAPAWSSAPYLDGHQLAITSWRAVGCVRSAMLVVSRHLAERFTEVSQWGGGWIRAGAAVSWAGRTAGGSDHQPARRRDGDDCPDPACAADHGQRHSGRAAAVRAGT